eukprot:scaffold71830_cov16-Prasinocladus_malaysianus.AAC.1
MEGSNRSFHVRSLARSIYDSCGQNLMQAFKCASKGDQYLSALRPQTSAILCMRCVIAPMLSGMTYAIR